MKKYLVLFLCILFCVFLLKPGAKQRTILDERTSYLIDLDNDGTKEEIEYLCKHTKGFAWEQELNINLFVNRRKIFHQTFDAHMHACADVFVLNPTVRQTQNILYIQINTTPFDSVCEEEYCFSRGEGYTFKNNTIHHTFHFSSDDAFYPIITPTAEQPDADRIHFQKAGYEGYQFLPTGDVILTTQAYENQNGALKPVGKSHEVVSKFPEK